MSRKRGGRCDDRYLSETLSDLCLINALPLISIDLIQVTSHLRGVLNAECGIVLAMSYY